MNPQQITDLLIHAGHVNVLVASQENGDPEIAWGDTFYYITDHAGQSPKMPFVTVVIKDYPGFDEASRLNRGGLFRVNIDVGKTKFNTLFGYLPAAHERHRDRFDYAALDTLFPHPLYATYGWASIINPSAAAAEQVKALLLAAHQRALHKVGVNHDKES